MAFDAFIKIDGIEGESTNDKHPGWIEALYYKTEVTQKISSTDSSAGGASAERADFLMISFLQNNLIRRHPN
jgi:type VI secretion system secreted protein Hcp